MCEKRGYPCPDYEEKDIMHDIERKTDIMIDDKTIKLAMELIGKSYAMDLLTNYTREVGTADANVVYALTGTYKPNSETETYKRWWHEEHKEAREGAGEEKASENG